METKDTISDCSKHPKDIAGITDMKVLAEMIGDLHYESLVDLFDFLRHKFNRDAVKDAEGGRYDLATSLHTAGMICSELFGELENTWEISKPFMK